MHIQYHILCLSSGNYDGLGAKRTQELKHAARIISPMIQVTVLDIPPLQDGPDESWTKAAIEDEMIHFLDNHFMNNGQQCLAKSSGADTCRAAEEVIILTFDEGGVSGHVNHVDTYHGLVHFYHKFTEAKKIENEKRLHLLSQRINLKLFTLETISNPVQKYVLIFQLLYILWNYILDISPMFEQRATYNYNKPNFPDEIIAQISFHMFQPFLVWSAMRAHYTQFVWYRRLFVIFSSYSYTNTLHAVESIHDDSHGGEKKKVE